MSSDFYIQGMNLLSQQLSQMQGEEIYNLTSCMNQEERDIVGILTALKKLPQVTPEQKKLVDTIIPFFSELGKARWVRTELTDLGLRVGNRNIQDTTDDEVIDDDTTATDIQK